jgi:hypothetical protein
LSPAQRVSRAWHDIVDAIDARDLHGAARSFIALFKNPADVEALKGMEHTKSEHATLEQLAGFMLPESETAEAGVAHTEKLSKLMPAMKLLENNPRLQKVVNGAYNVRNRVA